MFNNFTAKGPQPAAAAGMSAQDMMTGGLDPGSST